MDNHSKELSRQGLEAFSRNLSPEYAKLRQKLMERLGTSGITLANLVEKDKNERANVELLETFCRQLPKARQVKDWYKWEFASEDPIELRNINLNVVWAPTYVDNQKSTIPYYVVGASKEQAKKGVEVAALLLANASIYEDDYDEGDYSSLTGKLFCVSIDKNDRKQLQNHEALEGSDFPTPQEVSQMFNKEDHVFCMSYDNSRATRLYLYDTSLRIPRQADTKFVSHLSDQDLAIFDVNTYLHAMATQFAKEDLLKTLLNN